MEHALHPLWAAQYRSAYSVAAFRSGNTIRPPSQWTHRRSSHLKKGHVHVRFDQPTGLTSLL